MEDQVNAGRAKAIGLSNFNSQQIEKIVQSAQIKPDNLQVELHAFFQQKKAAGGLLKARYFRVRICYSWFEGKG